MSGDAAAATATGDQLHVNPDVLTAAAGAVDEAKDALAGATTALGSTVDGADNPWGSDEQGTAFSAVYQSCLSDVLHAMQSQADQLGYAAETLRDSAQAHQDHDSGVADVFNSLGGTT